MSPFVGDGVTCVEDSDEDGYPNSILSSCNNQTLNESYCMEDNCPAIFNTPQSMNPCAPSIAGLGLGKSSLYIMYVANMVASNKATLGF